VAAGLQACRDALVEAHDALAALCDFEGDLRLLSAVAAAAAVAARRGPVRHPGPKMEAPIAVCPVVADAPRAAEPSRQAAVDERTFVRHGVAFIVFAHSPLMVWGPKAVGLAEFDELEASPEQPAADGVPAHIVHALSMDTAAL